MRRLLLALLLFSSSASAQAWWGNSSTNGSTTITLTNTFQSVFVAVKRGGCAIQNNGTHTMWVYFGAIANATKAGSVVLSGGNMANCNVGNTTLVDQVSITGTTGDAFYADQW